MSSTLIPTANTQRAITNANNAIGGSDSGMCERFTRTCYGFPAAYSTANDAYAASKAAGRFHACDGSDAPAGSVMFWDITSGPNAAADHVAPVVATGVCVSTSAGPNKTNARVGIVDLTRRWGMRPRGWAEIYHGTALFTTGSTPTPDPEPIAPEDEDMKYSGSTTSKPLELEAGKWRTLRINDDGDLSLLTGTGPFHALVQLSASGLTPGNQLGVRFVLVDTKSGQDTRRHSTYPTTELVGTGGATEGQAVQLGSIAAAGDGWNRRLRAEAMTYEAGVCITSVQARAFQ